MSRRLPAALVAAGTVWLASLTACAGNAPATTDASGLPVNRPVKRSDLASREEAKLRFPGSVLIKAIGMGQTPTKSGDEPNPAFTGAILEVHATASQLYDFYGSSLERSGFTPTRYFLPADQTSGQAWQFQHRLQVQVGVFDPTLLRSEGGLAVHPGPGELVYESVLVGYAPGLPTF